MGEGVFLEVRHAPHTKAAGSSAPEFIWDLPTDAYSVTATKFGIVTPMGEWHISRGQTHPILRGGTQHPQHFWGPLMMPTVTSFGLVRQVEEDTSVSRVQPRALS